MVDARYTPRGIPVSSGASPRPYRVAGGMVDVNGLVGGRGWFGSWVMECFERRLGGFGKREFAVI